jgi:hypothetical protein
VQGVRIVKPPPGGDDDSPRVLNGVPGTSVALIATAPAGGLVAFDEGASRVESFVDDKGKDLTKRAPGEKAIPGVPNMWVIGMMPAMTKDRKHCIVDIDVPGLPTKQATTLALSGTLVFRVAHEKKDIAVEKVALRAGTEVKAGAIPLRITRAGKPQSGRDGDSMEIEFHAKQSLDAIVRVQFFDAAGNKIEADQSWRSYEVSPLAPDATPSDREATTTYRLKSAAETAKIVFTCWTDMKEVVVPFDVKVGLGL